jgi:hypothetical protein
MNGADERLLGGGRLSPILRKAGLQVLSLAKIPSNFEINSCNFANMSSGHETRKSEARFVPAKGDRCGFFPP